MNYAAEFQTVEAILACNAGTSGVDAFALSVIKAERQMRKLFTHLVFQAPALGLGDIPALRKALADNCDVYFEGFIAGWDVLYPTSIATLVGANYAPLRARLEEATRHRNKIFHGQLTNASLTTADLFAYVDDIKTWCSKLAEAANAEIGYDGFARNSFRKSGRVEIAARHRVNLTSVVDYQAFIHAHMER
jgi:hypothetical protein